MILDDKMYAHGLATLALSEAWGMSGPRDAKIREALKRSVTVILKAQPKSGGSRGGWRYEPRPSSADVSVTVMQLVALASAREAGVLVPDQAFEMGTDYVSRCFHDLSGGFTYMAKDGEPGFGQIRCCCPGTLLVRQARIQDGPRSDSLLEPATSQQVHHSQAFLLCALLRHSGDVSDR